VGAPSGGVAAMSADGIRMPVRVIRPISGWEWLDWRELFQYRDLFYFLVRRDIKVLYAQTILGFSWAILNPLIQIAIFAIIFGRVAGIETDGIPYILFVTVGIVPWTYVSDAMVASSQSLITEQHMLGKVYFPRLMYPLTPTISKLLDFAIALLLIAVALYYYRIAPTWHLLLLPLFVVWMVMIPAGVGMWLSALAVRFRDVKFAMQFAIRMLLYTAPILYTASPMPERYRLLYSLNPLVGLIEGFRASVLATEFAWEFILPGMTTTTLLFVSGMMYFRKMERVFADVV
jgi:homopolymeric O-antigen transport system permease protein